MVRHWKKVSSKPMGDYRIFKVRSDIRISPLTGKEHDLFVIDTSDWVNIIAVTPDQQLVMVEQFRFGTETVELEIPGGMMDKHEADPVATAVRELREETGYEGEQARVLGKVWANPAIMSNTCYIILIENCRLKHEVDFDPCEELATKLVPVADIPKMVAEEKIKHPHVVVALSYYELYLRGLKKG